MRTKSYRGYVSPPIKYNLSRRKLIPWINCIVENSEVDLENAKWIDPFFGAGEIGFNIHMKGPRIAGDLNPHIIAFYNAIKDGTITGDKAREYLDDANERFLESACKGNDYFRMVRDRFNKNHDPFDFMLLLNTTSKSVHRFNNNGDYNSTFCGRQDILKPGFVDKICGEIDIVAKKIRNENWTFICSDYEDLVRKYAEPDDFVFCDPPPFGMGIDMLYYGWGKDRDRRLYGVLKDLKCRFAYLSWQRVGERENPMISDIWLNYNMALKGHDTTFIKTTSKKQIIYAVFTNF